MRNGGRYVSHTSHPALQDAVPSFRLESIGPKKRRSKSAAIDDKDHWSSFGLTQSTLMTQGSRKTLGSTSGSNLWDTASSLVSRRSDLSSCTQFSRLSVASAENRKLREENDLLLMELKGLKGGAVTNRTMASTVASSARVSRRGSGVNRITSSSRSTDPGVAALAEKMRIKIYMKFRKLKAAFIPFDTENTGTLTPIEFYSAIKQLGLATDLELSGGRLEALVKICGEDGRRPIRYVCFADRLKALDTRNATS